MNGSSGSQQGEPKVGGQAPQPGSAQPQGVTPEASASGAAKSGEVIGGVQPKQDSQEKSGVEYYSASDYDNLDPTSVDFKRVRPEDNHLLYRRQASVHGRVTQETREMLNRQANEIRALNQMVRSLGAQSASALQQVAELLKFQKEKETGAQTAAEKAKEREIYESLPPEAQFMFDKLMKIASEVEQLKAGKNIPEDYDEMRSFFKSQKESQAQAEVAKEADRIIDGAISQFNLPEQIAKSKSFGKRVRAYIREAWEAQQQRGMQITPLPEITTWAIKWTMDEMKELGQLSGSVSQGGTPPETPGAQPGLNGTQSPQAQLTPEQIAAQSAPPRSTGSGGPASEGDNSIEARRRSGLLRLFNQLAGNE